MIDVEARKRAEFPAPAEHIWGLLADFGSIGDWWPEGGLEKVEVEGDGVGMVRHMHTVVGLVVAEKLDALDVERMELELSITGDLPAGMQGYRARGRVIASGPDRCEVDWSGRFRVPDEEAVEPARRFIQSAYETMFLGLAQALVRGSVR